MFKNNKYNMVFWVLLVLAFIVFMFFAINNKDSSVNEEQNINIMSEEIQNVEGVKITILKEGTGEEVAESGNMVAMAYTGMFLDGTVFDSNLDPKFNHVEPFVFNLGAGQVIKGWDVGLVGMKVGEQRKLEIKSDFAYGANGAGDVIPPNADLIFVVELVAIKK